MGDPVRVPEDVSVGVVEGVREALWVTDGVLELLGVRDCEPLWLRVMLDVDVELRVPLLVMLCDRDCVTVSDGDCVCDALSV